MRHKWSLKDIRRMSVMAEAGKSARIIGYEIGVTKRSVIGAAARYGVPLLARPGRRRLTRQAVEW